MSQTTSNTAENQQERSLILQKLEAQAKRIVPEYQKTKQELELLQELAKIEGYRVNTITGELMRNRFH